MILNGVNYWALDIETEQWDTLVLFILTDGVTILEGSTKQDLSKAYQKVPHSDVILSHNGGRFDFLCLLDAHDDNWSAILANGIISMQPVKGALCIDTYRLFVLSLAKWTNTKTKLPFPCTCLKSCGGYCAISVNMKAEDRQILRDYCLNDALILLKQYVTDMGMLEKEGFNVYNKDGKPKKTIGSVAYYTAKDVCGLEDGVIERDFYDSTIESFYGGRTECFRRSCDVVYRYDINSAYPHALTLPVPIGKPRNVVGLDALKAYDNNQPGLYHVTGYQQATDRLAVVPRRSKDGRVIWATGFYDDTYTLPEAKLAAQYSQQFGVKTAIIWDNEQPIYKNYILKCFELRQKYKEEGLPFEYVLKILLNSLYGKTVQGLKHSKLQKFNSIEDYPYGDEWKQLADTKYWIQESKGNIAESAKPWQGAYITARTRVKLFERLIRNKDHLVYCDTDSTFLSREDKQDNGLLLGDFKDEGVATGFVGIAPKVYKYTDDKNKTTSKAKGVPDSHLEDIFDNYAEGKTIRTTKGVNSLKTSLKKLGSSFTRRDMTRTNNTSPLVMGTRLIVGSSSKPLHFNGKRFDWIDSELKPENIIPWLKKEQK